MTLRDLIEKHGMGHWLADKSHPHIKDFKPLAYSEVAKSTVIGECRTHVSMSYTLDADCFVKWEEPKKKIKRWKYALLGPMVVNWEETTFFYTEEQAVIQFSNCKYQKLLYSEQEFDE